MRAKFDQLSKAVIDRVLGPAGAVVTQHEIVSEVQAADVWFRPAAGGEAARARLGLLGRMAESACLFEPFHAAPSTGEVLDCMNKQLNLRGMLLRETARQPPAAAPWPRSLVPRLWILSAGRPERAIRSLQLAPMDGWQPGFWQAAPLLRLHLVVLRDLPETRETLLLRLLGRGRTLRRAIDELHALPADAWEAELAIPLLLAFGVGVSQDSREGRMQQTSDVQAIYEEWERRVKHASWKAGEEAGRRAGEEAERQHLRASLRQVYQARFGALPPEVEATIGAMEDIATLQRWIVLFATEAPEAITALARDR